MHQRQEFGRDSDSYREWREQALIQRDKDYARVRESILGPYRNERTRFARVAMGLSRISPLASYTYGATRLANTGPRTDEGIDEAIEQLRIGLADTEAELRKGRRWGGGRRNRERKINIDMLPKFQYEPESIRERIVGASTDAVILVAMNILFFLGTYVSFLRMDLVQ